MMMLIIWWVCWVLFAVLYITLIANRFVDRVDIDKPVIKELGEWVTYRTVSQVGGMLLAFITLKIIGMLFPLFKYLLSVGFILLYELMNSVI